MPSFRVLLTLALLSAPTLLRADDGVLPKGPDGKTLNFDFETGTLKDGTAEGDAFKDQPIKGDTVAPRRGDKSNHQGNYWIGGYEKHGDRPQGTLTSVAFEVTHPWAACLIGGGVSPNTCFEIHYKDNDEGGYPAPGLEPEAMRRVAIDMSRHKGKMIYLRLVDKESGGWGHINFDDFRFHTEKPNVPAPPKALVPDKVAYAGLPPEKAAQIMTVPPGFDVKLFA